MAGRLQGKVAVVTGAGSGIGRAIARSFHGEGAKVVLGDVSGGEELLADELGDGAIATRADMTRASDVASLVQVAIDRFSGLHVMVNCAGISGVGALTADIDEGDFDRVIEVNLKSTFLGMRAALPPLLAGGGGSIVNIASVAASVGFQTSAGYSASKGAIMAMTRCTALEYAASGVRVNAICPGFIDTALYRGYAAENVEEVLAEAARMTPLGRMGVPVDVAAAALFLATDDSSFLTGTAVTVDGGYTAQ